MVKETESALQFYLTHRGERQRDAKFLFRHEERLVDPILKLFPQDTALRILYDWSLSSYRRTHLYLNLENRLGPEFGKEESKCLVVSVDGIGDAIFAKGIFEAIGKVSRGNVDLLVPRKAEDLFTYDQDIGSNVYYDDSVKLRDENKILRQLEYDQVVSIWPPRLGKFFRERGIPIFSLVLNKEMAVEVAKTVITGSDKENIGLHAQRMIYQLARKQGLIEAEPEVELPTLWLSEESVMWSKNFLLNARIDSSRDLLVGINPDTYSPFTRPPARLLTSVIEELVNKENERIRILLCSGFDKRGVEEEIFAALNLRARGKTRIVPHTSLLNFAALMNEAELFISGDTGPLHVVVAKKAGVGDLSVKKGPDVLQIFGLSHPELYGYQGEYNGRKMVVVEADYLRRPLLRGALKDQALPKDMVFIKSVTPEQVVSNALKLLQSRNNPIY